MKLEPRQEQLYNAVSDIDQKYIDEALSAKPGKRGYTIPKRLAALAATLALLLTPWGKIFTPAANPTDGSSTPVKPQAPVSLFAITVSASENEEVDMEASVGATAYSSVAAEEEIQLDDDQPVFIYNQETGEIETYDVTTVNSTFRINIWPNEHVPDIVPTYYEVIYKSTSKIVTTDDEHLKLSRFVFKTLEDGEVVTGAGFSGWLTEPTEIIVNLYSMETNEIIQQMTFNITPTISSAASNNTTDNPVNIEGYLIEMTEINQY